MKNEILKDALQVEQLEERFEMTVAALDGDRCTADGNDVDTGGSGGSGGGGGGTGSDGPSINAL